jgi:hypothetical protein
LCVAFSAQTQITIGKRPRLFVRAKKSLISSLPMETSSFCHRLCFRILSAISKPASLTGVA